MPAGTTATYAFGINAQGHIVGTYLNRTGSHGFLLHHGAYVTLDVPGAAQFTEASGNTLGFLLRHGSYTTIDDPLATGGTSAFGINASGAIVGGVRRRGRPRSRLPPVPWHLPL